MFPNVRMATRMGQVICVWLCLAERRAVNEHFATDDPEDAYMGLRQSPRCLALDAFMQFLHWLILAPHRIALISGASFFGHPYSHIAPATAPCICASTRQQHRLPWPPSSVPFPLRPNPPACARFLPRWRHSSGGNLGLRFASVREAGAGHRDHAEANLGLCEESKSRPPATSGTRRQFAVAGSPP